MSESIHVLWYRNSDGTGANILRAYESESEGIADWEMMKEVSLGGEFFLDDITLMLARK